VLYTVLKYVTATVNGVASPGLSSLSAAYFTPPTAGSGSVDQMLLFIWSDSLNEVRQTMPRQQNGIASTAGFKLLTHQVSIYSMLLADAGDLDMAQKFFQGMDAVMATLRAVELPVSLTDPDTGVLSYAQHLGESFKLQTDVVRSLKDQRYVRMLGKLTTEVKEQVQA
jgi:hypothetical protein